MASVAMNESTRKRTTMRPDTKPTAPHASTASNDDTKPLSPVLAWSQLTITSEKASMLPTDRSNTPAVRGMSRREGEDGHDDLIATHDLERGRRQERVGDPQPEQHEDEREEVQRARLLYAGEAECAAAALARRAWSLEPSDGLSRFGQGRRVGRASNCSCSMRSALISRRLRRTAARPRRSTTTSVQMRASSSASVEHTTTTAPAAAASSTRRWMSAFDPTSTPCVGSSSTSTDGSTRSQRAMTTFCWFPPESSSTGLLGLRRAHVELRHPLLGVAPLDPVPQPALQPERREIGEREVLPHARRWGAAPGPADRRARSTCPRRRPRRGSPGRTARPPTTTSPPAAAVR